MTGATIAEAPGGAAAQPGTMRVLTFHRARSVTIPAGQITASDAAALPVTPPPITSHAYTMQAPVLCTYLCTRHPEIRRDK